MDYDKSKTVGLIVLKTLFSISLNTYFSKKYFGEVSNKFLFQIKNKYKFIIEMINSLIMIMPLTIYKITSYKETLLDFSNMNKKIFINDSTFVPITFAMIILILSSKEEIKIAIEKNNIFEKLTLFGCVDSIKSIILLKNNYFDNLYFDFLLTFSIWVLFILFCLKSILISNQSGLVYRKNNNSSKFSINFDSENIKTPGDNHVDNKRIIFSDDFNFHHKFKLPMSPSNQKTKVFEKISTKIYTETDKKTDGNKTIVKNTDDKNSIDEKIANSSNFKIKNGFSQIKQDIKSKNNDTKTEISTTEYIDDYIKSNEAVEIEDDKYSNNNEFENIIQKDESDQDKNEVIEIIDYRDAFLKKFIKYLTLIWDVIFDNAILLIKNKSDKYLIPPKLRILLSPAICCALVLSYYRVTDYSVVYFSFALSILIGCFNLLLLKLRLGFYMIKTYNLVICALFYIMIFDFNLNFSKDIQKFSLILSNIFLMLSVSIPLLILGYVNGRMQKGDSFYKSFVLTMIISGFIDGVIRWIQILKHNNTMILNNNLILNLYENTVVMNLLVFSIPLIFIKLNKNIIQRNMSILLGVFIFLYYFSIGIDSLYINKNNIPVNN